MVNNGSLIGKQKQLGLSVGAKIINGAVNFWLLLLIVIAVSVRASEETFETGYRRTVLYSGGNETNWVMGESFSRARLSGQDAGVNWSVVFLQSMPDGDLKRRMDPASEVSSGLSGNEAHGRLAGRIFFQERYSQVRLEFSNAARSVWGSMQMRQEQGDRTERRAGVTFKPSEWIEAGLTMSREYPLPSYSTLRYEYLDSDQLPQFEGGRFDWLAPADMSRLYLKLRPSRRIHVESRISEANFNPLEPVPQQSLNSGFTGVLDGFWQDDLLRVGYQRDNGWNYSIDYRRLRLNSRLRLYENGYRFGYFGIVKFHARQWSFQIERQSRFISFHRGNAEGELLGAVEAWPFLKGLLRFLGERRHFVAKGNIKWHYLSAGSSLRTWKSFQLNGAANVLLFETDIRQVNWRPILGMGINDLRSDRVDLKEAALVRLKIEPSYRWKGWQLQLSVSQWVPLLIRKYSDAIEPQPQNQAPDGGSSANSDNVLPDDGKSVWGGFNAQLKLLLAI